MRYQTIQSDANAKFKRWKKLADNTRFIKKEGATLAEGAHLVLTLSERKIKPAALIFRASGVSDEVSEVIRRWSDEGVECYVLDNKLYDQISPVEHGAGVIAEVKIKEEPLPQHDRPCHNHPLPPCPRRVLSSTRGANIKTMKNRIENTINIFAY